MKKQLRILMLGLFVAVVFSSTIWAEQRTENRRRRQGEVRGAFVGLAEREFGEREHLAIVIKPLESDDYVAVLVPRNEDFMHAARTLQKGDRVEIGYVVEDEQKWLKKIGIERTRRIETERRREEVEERREVRRPPLERDVEETDRPRRDVERRREGERERPEPRRPWARLEQMEGQLKEIIAAHLGRMRREFRVLLNRVEQLEKQVQELRAENARLRRQLKMRERESSGRGRERDVRARRDPEPRREARERAEAREREERREREVSEERGRARRDRAERQERAEAREREEVRERKEVREREEREERERARKDRAERREREEIRDRE